MVMSIRALLAIGAALVPLTLGEGVQELTGTWTTKSRKVVTGPVCILYHLDRLLRNIPLDTSILTSLNV